jgi:hypothetical protein
LFSGRREPASGPRVSRGAQTPNLLPVCTALYNYSLVPLIDDESQSAHFRAAAKGRRSPVTLILKDVSLLLVMAFGLSAAAVTITGRLELTDLPPSATPLEAYSVRLHPEAKVQDIDAQPDRNGYFKLNPVPPGRYSLILPVPARITSFLSSSPAFDPAHIEIGTVATDDWRIIVSLRTAVVSVSVIGAPANHGELAALLCPDDPWLTLRESCHVNTIPTNFLDALTGVGTVFRYIPCGRYRLFIVDSRFSGSVAGRAPHFPKFLVGEAVPVDALHGDTRVLAKYLASDEVERAIAAYQSSFKPN